MGFYGWGWGRFGPSPFHWKTFLSHSHATHRVHKPTHAVFLDHWSPLMCPAYDGKSMTVTIGFHVCPEPGQPPDTDEQVQKGFLDGLVVE